MLLFRKIVAVVIVLAAMVGSVQADTVSTVQSGNWNNLATWGGVLPTANDFAYIQPGHTVTADTAGTAQYLIVGINWATGTGTLNVNSGADLNLVAATSNSTSLSIGYYGTDGIINITGGKLVSNGWSSVGDNNNVGIGSKGYLNISGGEFTTLGDGHLVIGNAGASGTAVQTGGVVNLTGDLRVGMAVSDTGTSKYKISGTSTLTIGGNLYVGYYSNSAEFRVSGTGSTINVAQDVVSRYGTDLGQPVKFAFDIGPTGISPIIVGGFVNFANTTNFEITGGMPGESYTLFRISKDTPYYHVSGLSNVQVNNPVLYNVSSAPGPGGTFDVVVTVSDCTSENDEDFNGDCKINFVDFAYIAGNWLETGTLQ